MKILIINSAEPEVREFVALLAEIVEETGSNFDVEEYLNLPMTNIELYDGLIISGSPRGNDIVGHHLPYFHWLKGVRKPVLGICAGHHIAGVLFGSELYRSKEVEVGEISVEILEKYPIFQEMQGRFGARTMHHDSISLPMEFELIATSSTCQNQAMKRIGHDFYTFQFHPEIMNPQIIQNFIIIVKNGLKG